MPCQRGAELQAAREAAGMTHDQVARRLVTVRNLRNPHRNAGRAPDEFSEADRNRLLPQLAREVSRLERTSQGAYERAREESERRSADIKYCKQLTHDTWRAWPSKFDEYESVIALGHAEASADELRDALGIVTAANAEVQRAARLATLAARGASIARLVWNDAEDSEFLDQALFEELRVPESYRDGRVDGAAGYLVRSALMELAHELRVTFPERPAMELNLRGAA